MGVLEVGSCEMMLATERQRCEDRRTSVSLEGGHASPLKLVVINPASNADQSSSFAPQPRTNAPLRRHVLNLDRRDSEDIARLLRVVDGSVLDLVRLHLLVHDVLALVEDLVEEDGRALASRHSEDHSERDVLKALAPLVSHEV